MSFSDLLSLWFSDCLLFSNNIMLSDSDSSYYVLRWIRQQVILRSSHFSEHKREEFMMHICFLSIDKNYRNHTSFNLISKVQSQEKWVKTQVLINSECELMSTIDTKYVQKQHLQTWKLKHNKVLRNFNRKITWITYLVIIKLWFDRHVKHVELYVHDLKNNYDMILKFQWLK